MQLVAISVHKKCMMDTFMIPAEVEFSAPALGCEDVRKHARTATGSPPVAFRASAALIRARGARLLGPVNPGPNAQRLYKKPAYNVQRPTYDTTTKTCWALPFVSYNHKNHSTSCTGGGAVLLLVRSEEGREGPENGCRRKGRLPLTHYYYVGPTLAAALIPPPPKQEAAVGGS